VPGPFLAFFRRCSTNAALERCANAAVHSFGRVPVNTTQAGTAWLYRLTRKVAWIVVMITAAITAFAGLAAGRRVIPVPEVPANAELADDGVAIACGTSATRG